MVKYHTKGKLLELDTIEILQGLRSALGRAPSHTSVRGAKNAKKAIADQFEPGDIFLIGGSTPKDSAMEDIGHIVVGEALDDGKFRLFPLQGEDLGNFFDNYHNFDLMWIDQGLRPPR